MLPPMSPNGPATQSFWALTSVSDAHSQAFHLGAKPGFRGKKMRMRISSSAFNTWLVWT